MRTLALLTFLTGLALPTVVAGVGQDKHVATGRQMYQTYCSSCHGTEGAGDGVLAKSLRKRPPDLTQLSSKATDGRFQAEQVSKAIEGADRHGNSDMPGWSDAFAKMRETTGPDDVKAKIAALVDYLESIQQPQR